MTRSLLHLLLSWKMIKISNPKIKKSILSFFFFYFRNSNTFHDQETTDQQPLPSSPTIASFPSSLSGMMGFSSIVNNNPSGLSPPISNNFPHSPSSTHVNPSNNFNSNPNPNLGIEKVAMINNNNPINSNIKNINNNSNINNNNNNSPSTFNHQQIKSTLGAQTVNNTSPSLIQSFPSSSGSSIAAIPTATATAIPTSITSNSTLSPHHIQQIKSQLYSQQHQTTSQAKNALIQATLISKVPPFRSDWINDQIFLDSLNKFHIILNQTPLRKIPIIGGRTLSLLALFKLVIGHGGFKIVYYQKKWPLIAANLGFSNCNSELLTAIYTIYFNLLWTFEQWMIRRIPVDQLEYPSPFAALSTTTNPNPNPTSTSTSSGSSIFTTGPNASSSFIPPGSSNITSSMMTGNSGSSNTPIMSTSLSSSNSIPLFSNPSLNLSATGGIPIPISSLNNVNVNSSSNNNNNSLAMSFSSNIMGGMGGGGINNTIATNTTTANIGTHVSGSSHHGINTTTVASASSSAIPSSHVPSFLSKKRKILTSLLDLELNQIKGLNLKRILIHNPELLGSIQYDDVIGLLIYPPTTIKGLNILLAMSFMGISPSPSQLRVIWEIIKKYLFVKRMNHSENNIHTNTNINTNTNDTNDINKNSDKRDDDIYKLSNIKIKAMENQPQTQSYHYVIKKNIMNNNNDDNDNNNDDNNNNEDDSNDNDNLSFSLPLHNICISIMRNWSSISFTIAKDLCQIPGIIEWIKNYQPSTDKDILIIKDNISHLIPSSIKDAIFPDLFQCSIDMIRKTVKSYRSYFYTNVFLSLMLPEDFISTTNTNTNININTTGNIIKDQDGNTITGSSGISDGSVNTVTNTGGSSGNTAILEKSSSEEIDKKGWNKFNYIIHGWFKIFPPKLVLILTILWKEMMRNNHSALKSADNAPLIEALVESLEELVIIFISMIICGCRITCLLIKRYQALINSSSSPYQKIIKSLEGIVHSPLHSFADFGIMEITFSILSLLSLVKPNLFVVDNGREKEGTGKEEKRQEENKNTTSSKSAFISGLFQTLVETRRIWQSFDDSFFKFDFEMIQHGGGSGRSSSSSTMAGNSASSIHNNPSSSYNHHYYSKGYHHHGQQGVGAGSSSMGTSTNTMGGGGSGSSSSNYSPLIYNLQNIGSTPFEIFKRLLEIINNLSSIPSICKILVTESNAVEIISQWMVVKNCPRSARDLIASPLQLGIYNEILCNLLVNS